MDLIITVETGHPGFFAASFLKKNNEIRGIEIWINLQIFISFKLIQSSPLNEWNPFIFWSKIGLCVKRLSLMSLILSSASTGNN